LIRYGHLLKIPGPRAEEGKMKSLEYNINDAIRALKKTDDENLQGKGLEFSAPGDGKSIPEILEKL
jgi:hypothetical protein